jgi:uncharacterized membrane protein (UPF0127 family)
MSRKVALAAALLLAAAVAASALGTRSPAELRDLPQSSVQVVTDSGRHRFKVWIAATEESQQRGLMFVRELPPKHGLLFLFPEPRYTSFWMKDTFLALDIIFIAADGRVARIVAGAQPLSLVPMDSGAPVKAALEVTAGTAERIGLEPGDRVLHPALGAPGGKTAAP